MRQKLNHMHVEQNQFVNLKKMGETLDDFSKINRLTRQLFSENVIFNEFSTLSKNQLKSRILPPEMSKKYFRKPSGNPLRHSEMPTFKEGVRGLKLD